MAMLIDHGGFISKARLDVIVYIDIAEKQGQ